MSGRTVLIAAALAFSACSSDDAAPSTTAGASATAAAPSAATAPTASTTDASPTTTVVPSLPTVFCCDALPLDPGTYALPAAFAPLTTVDVPADLVIINDPAARYLAFGRGENEVGTPSATVTILRGSSDKLEAIRAAIEAAPELELVSGGGTDRLELRARPNPSFEGAPAADIAAGTQRLTALQPLVTTGFGLTTSTPEALLEVTFRSEGELLVVAVVEAPAAEFESFAADAEGVVTSLR